jgi:curli biogenesis system outer membrane secretion channel CsgG
MKKILVVTVACLFLAAVPAFSQDAAKPAPADVAGAWDTTLESPQGPMQVVTTFKQDGEKITGTQASPMGEAPLEGTVVGNEIKFTIKIDMQGNQMVISFTAKVEGDAMTGTFDFGGMGSGSWSAKKKQ